MKDLTSVLCTDGITILMCPCVLLDKPGIFSHRINDFAYVLHIQIPVVHLVSHVTVSFLAVLPENKDIQGSFNGIFLCQHI